MKIREILTNSIWFGIVPKLSYVITLIITPFITPYMTAEDYGILGVETSYVGLLTGFATFGLHVHLSNSFFSYGKKFQKVWRRLIFWMYIGAFFTYITSVFFLMFTLPSVTPYSRVIVCILCSLPIITNVNNVIAQHYYLNSLEPKPLVFRNFISSISENFIFFILVYFFHLGFMGKIISTTISNILLFILFIPPLWKKIGLYPLPNKVSRRVQRWFIVALPIIPHTVGHLVLSNSDRIVMNLLKIPVSDIGLYSHGYTFGNYVSILIDAISGSLSPVIQKTYRSKNKNQMKKIFIFLQCCAFIIVFFISIWMKTIYRILIRNDVLHEASFIAFFTCFSFLVSPLYAFLSNISFIEEKTKNVLWLIFVPAIVNVLLNFCLLPYYGYKIAILTTLIAYWGMLLVVIFVPYYRNIICIWFGGIKSIFIIIFLSLILLIIAYFLYNTTLIIRLIFTLILFFIGTFLFIKNYKKIKSIKFIY